VSRAVLWDFPARAYRVRLPLATQSAISRAVIRFAETGEGGHWEPPYHHVRVMVQEAIYEAELAIDEKAETVTVIRIFRRMYRVR
jgi:hypothetical protein